MGGWGSGSRSPVIAIGSDTFILVGLAGSLALIRISADGMSTGFDIAKDSLSQIPYQLARFGNDAVVAWFGGSTGEHLGLARAHVP